MSILIEQYVPVVRENGIKTNKTITVGGSANLDLSASTGAVKGLAAQILSGQAATVTLTTAQSGATCLFDSAAGIVYTLPVPLPGDFFDFVVTTTVTSNNAKVITSSGSVFIAGSVTTGINNTADKQWVGDGATHLAVTQNGTTTGGVIGSWLRLYAATTTLWIATGSLVGSGTLATPFATS